MPCAHPAPSLARPRYGRWAVEQCLHGCGWGFFCPNHLPIPDSHPLFPWPASFRDNICVALMQKIATVEFWAQEGPVRPVSVVYKGSYFLTLLPGVPVAGPWLRP
jgi:hypothetical protein